MRPPRLQRASGSRQRPTARRRREPHPPPIRSPPSPPSTFWKHFTVCLCVYIHPRRFHHSPLHLSVTYSLVLQRREVGLCSASPNLLPAGRIPWRNIEQPSRHCEEGIGMESQQSTGRLRCSSKSFLSHDSSVVMRSGGRQNNSVKIEVAGNRIRTSASRLISSAALNFLYLSWSTSQEL